MKRIILRLLDLISMLSLIVVSVLWALTYSAPPVHAQAKLGRWEWRVFLWQGRFELDCTHLYITPVVGPALGPFGYDESKDSALHSWSQRFIYRSHSFKGLRVAYYESPASGTIQGQGLGPHGNAAEWGICRGVQAPFWTVALALAILPVSSVIFNLIRRRRERRRNPKACIQCGYDLRATPDRCPECGRLADGHKPATASTNQGSP